jgi:hypothetical protein
MAGGLSSPTSETFVYKNSTYIKVDIEFTQTVEGSRDKNPKDIVKKISKPYLDYFTYD